jgi:hypothetical protein
MIDFDALGGLIRAARLRQGWRPIDLALEMGWSGTAPVYRLERPGPDTPRPSSDTINLLAQVLGLDYGDRMLMLGLAGHLPDTELLSPQEESALVTITQSMMDGANHPMVLVDNRIRILSVNEAFWRPFELDPGAVASWRAAGVTGFDLLWDPRHGLTDFLGNVEHAVEGQMLRFKLDNRLRRHEAWYRAYPARNAHYPGFVELWQRTDDLLAQPPAAWDLERVMRWEMNLHSRDGQPLQLKATRMMVHAGYGLVYLAAYVPRDDRTRQWLDRPVEFSQTPSHANAVSNHAK